MEIFLTRSSSCKVWWILWRYLYCYPIVKSFRQKAFFYCWNFACCEVLKWDLYSFIHQVLTEYQLWAVLDIALIESPVRGSPYLMICSVKCGAGWVEGEIHPVSWLWGVGAGVLDKRPMWWRRPPSRQLLASVIGDSAKLAPIGLRFFSLTHIFLHQPLCLSLFWASERPLFTSSFSGCCCTSLENSPGPSHEGRFSSSLCFHASPYFSSHLSQFLITH